MSDELRIERDSMGEVHVPADALWGAQTQRAVENFPISGQPMPSEIIRALGLIKGACAFANNQLGHLDDALAEAIIDAADDIAKGARDDQFPIDLFQTGSGTSTNMNANEVIARLASRATGVAVHPNDHVNYGQSSNDVFPSAIRVATILVAEEQLIPAVEHLAHTIEERARELEGVVKMGRTHLMDAMPIHFSQELGAWAAQLRNARRGITDSLERVRELPIGGTAVGTGINAPDGFAEAVVLRLTRDTGRELMLLESAFVGIGAQDALVELSGQVRVLAVSVLKIANDLRWMNSGPLAGLAEIELPKLQPGSSIMPGKVNPVIPEAVAMVCAQVMGNDLTVAVAGGSGSFQLNVMLPVLAANLLQSLELLSNACRVLADKAIRHFRVNRDHLDDALRRSPQLVTALNPVIGYELGAKIAKKALAEKRPVIEVAREMTELGESELEALLEPHRLARGGGINRP